MRKSAAVLLVIFMSILLAGCAGSGTMQAEKPMKVKCPECGHEFYPQGGGHYGG